LEIEKLVGVTFCHHRWVTMTCLDGVVDLERANALRLSVALGEGEATLSGL